MLRSSYFQNSRDVGPKHFASLERQLGPLDGQFAAAGLKQPREFYLTVVRVGYGALSDENSEKLRGILLADKNSEQLPEFIEGALKSDPEAYAKVRVVFRWANQFLFRPLVGDGIINSPEFTVCSLVSMLAAEKLGFSMSHVLDKLPAPQGFQALVSSFCDAVGERNKS